MFGGRDRAVPELLRSKLSAGKHRPQMLHKRCFGKLHYPWGTLRMRKGTGPLQGVCQTLRYEINAENWTPSSSNVPMINTTSVRQRRQQFGFCWDIVNPLASFVSNVTILIYTTSLPGLERPSDHNQSHLSPLNHSNQINLLKTEPVSSCSKTSRDSCFIQHEGQCPYKG